MSGGSQHNPNGRQAQIGAGWSPLQMASLLARAPQAHMSAERGVTWHTPTPPAHLYHVPAPSPPDPLQVLQLQAMKGASVFRHGLDANPRLSGTPPDHYRHTPTPPDKHHMRHTPSPGDPKSGAAMSPVDLFPHLGSARDKVPRPDELLSLARGVDLSVTRGPPHAGPPPHAAPPPAHAGAPALSVRDAPTINSLIARVQPRGGATRVDSLLERLGAPLSPHSVIMHARHDPPSPHSSNEDSTDSCGAPPGSKRKRKPERTIRVPLPAGNTAARLTPPNTLENGDAHKHNGPQKQTEHVVPEHETPERVTPGHRSPGPNISVQKSPGHNTPVQKSPGHNTPVHKSPEHNTTVQKSPGRNTPVQNTAMYKSPMQNTPLQNTSVQNTPGRNTPEQNSHARRKSSSETIDEIAAMIKNPAELEKLEKPAEIEAPVTIDKLKSVLANSVEVECAKSEKSPAKSDNPPEIVKPAAAPKRRAARASNSESTNVPVESPSEAKPAETSAEPLSQARTSEPIGGPSEPTAGPVEPHVDKSEPNVGPAEPHVEPPSEPQGSDEPAEKFVEVENQLEKMFAGLEEEPKPSKTSEKSNRGRKRRKSAPSKGEAKAGRRDARATTGEERRRGGKRGGKGKDLKECDSGSNASSSRSRGPFIQIRGPRESPLSVSVVNATTEEDGEGAPGPRRKDEFRNGMRIRGLHQSTLGLRYDATTPDVTWICAFCQRGPHAAGLGDLFGPYTVDTDCDEFRALRESHRRLYTAQPEVWVHESCAVWAPGVIAGGARVWGLGPAVFGARTVACQHCGNYGATIACLTRGCPARSHIPCATSEQWTLDEQEFRATCPKHTSI